MQDQDKIEEELKRLLDWSLDDLQKLARGLEAMIRQRKSEQPRYNVLDFEGVARGMWDEVGGIDEFIRQERASWDEPQPLHKAREFKGAC